MKTKHTQGEWEIKGDKIISKNLKAHRLVTIAQYESFPLEGEAEANAKLIASAPELLEALIEARAKVLMHTVLELGYGNVPMFPKLLGKIDNAIKKATE